MVIQEKKGDRNGRKGIQIEQPRWQTNGKLHPLFLYMILPEISISKWLSFGGEGHTNVY